MSDEKKKEQPIRSNPRGRPNQRIDDKEEALNMANLLLDEYKQGRTNFTEIALRRKINILGENPKNPNERWFSYSSKKGTPLILPYERKDADIKGSKSKIKDNYITPNEPTKQQSSSSLERNSPTKQQSSSSSQREPVERKEPVEQKEFNWDSIVFDPDDEYLENLEPIVKERRPEISELMDSSIETIRNVEDLNQNVLGINECMARRFIDNIGDDINQRAIDFLTQDYFERGITSLIPSENKYDIEQLSDSMSSSVRRDVYDVMESKYDEVATRLNFDSEGIEGTMKDLAIQRLQEVASSVGMIIPKEIFSYGSETIKRLLESSDISIDRDDVKNALNSIGVENFEMSNIPFGGLIDTASNILSEKVPMIKTIKNITDKVPESLRNKVIQAGGSLKDTLRFKGERKEEKDNKEERPERRPYQGFPALKGVSDIFGRTRGGSPDDQPDDPPDNPPEQPVRDQRSLLIDEINNINLRLEDLSRGKRMAYPEKQDIKKPYRFPRPNENYSAVPLVQNAMTNYLNDLNLYGSTDYVNYNEI